MSAFTMIFAPAPVLTVTVEQRAATADVRMHAGGRETIERLAHAAELRPTSVETDHRIRVNRQELASWLRPN